MAMTKFNFFHRFQLSFEDKMQREKYGGDVHFVCLDNENEEDEYNLHQHNGAQRAYIKGEKYRICCTADRNRSEVNTLWDHMTTFRKAKNSTDPKQCRSFCLFLYFLCCFGMESVVTFQVLKIVARCLNTSSF